jgi:hypothetical protein
VEVLKPGTAYRAYGDMLVYYGVKTLAEYFPTDDAEARGLTSLAALEAAHPGQQSLAWVNLGGQLVPEHRADTLRGSIREGRITDWGGVHGEYDRLWEDYPLDRALNALQVLRYVTGSAEVSEAHWEALVTAAQATQLFIAAEVGRTKARDYTDPFRLITYRTLAERDAVLGPLEDNPCIKRVQEEGQRFIALTHSP